MNSFRNIVTTLVVAVPFLCLSQNISNPVISNVADAGVIKYAGRYYLGGVNTFGDFLISKDLVHWNKRIHVFDLDNDWTHGTGAKNNQIHADDITYSNGLFHLLFSVNYWGNDRHIVHITHATSPYINGPFQEVRKDQWFENRIDPQIFCDEDGHLYLYMVKFTDGNTIWGRPLNSDFTFAGDAVQQFSSQQGTWETMDNRVAEGPFVIKYHGRYYMMYNTNHTAIEYGNYRLGVCEASSPLAFGPGGKYSHPVVVPTTEAINDHYTDLITYGNDNYCPPDLTRDTIDFYIKHQITAGNLYLKIAQRDGCEIQLNNQLINGGSDRDYKIYKISNRMVEVGHNRIIVHRKSTNSNLISLALYNSNKDLQGDMLLTPGQPNILRGPNGWEWWLIYMANKAWKRDQYIDRIHFTSGHLYVDGITGSETKDFHPVPSSPQYSGKSLDSIPALSDAYLLELTFKASTIHNGINIGGYEIYLPETMKQEVSHVWRIEKNYDLMTVWIDNVLVVDHVITNIRNKKIEWIGDKTSYNIDYISYNDGWDEYSNHFSGWNGLTINKTGLNLGVTDILKGDYANSYELSVQFDNSTPSCGCYGVYASYQNSKNYMRVIIDAKNQKIIAENCINGKLHITGKTLKYTDTYYPDLKYSDSFEKQYRFDANTYISSVDCPRLDADNDTYFKVLSLSERRNKSFHKNIIGKMQLSYLDGDTWRELNYNEAESDSYDWQRITFKPFFTNALRMVNKDPNDYNRNVYRVKIETDFSSTYQLRIEKKEQNIHVFINNTEMFDMLQKDKKPGRIGLYSDGKAAVTVANSLYYKVY
jgi:hypothetical protein